ncbi:MAG: hypothetical protein QOI66_3059 [Myxococcales bacterium]|nr:hypothetical protein [Myxococcales bacterium]
MNPTLVGYTRGSTAAEMLVQREWLLTNGIGGYASGTVGGVITRRFHGLLVASLRNPLGRTMMLNQLGEWLLLPGAEKIPLGGVGTTALAEFRLELGLPVWTYDVADVRIEKRVFLPARQNTVGVIYRLLGGPASVNLGLRPAIQIRPHEASVSAELPSYTVSLTEDRFELSAGSPYPALRMFVKGEHTEFAFEPSARSPIEYAIEEARGYDWRGALWSRGRFDLTLEKGKSAIFVASVEDWETLLSLDPEELYECEISRRQAMLGRSTARPSDDAGDATAAQLLLSADAFIVSPVGRNADAVRARARGDSLRSIIAGYHWFTDWGRDTMISLEGLCLLTERHREARWILRTFAGYVRNGLIPNLFPEGSSDGLYHTADATLWFFHALDRYLAYSGDFGFLRELMPLLENIIRQHVTGTRFGIRVDPHDGLLSQGEEGYALTWMDAKCGDWVVTPRRGKAVEINALWYNAVSLMAGWMKDLERPADADELTARAKQVDASFNERFWFNDGGYLYDVIDGPDAKLDPALRPNQIFALSLPHPILNRERWRPVLTVVEQKLLTPFGLRSLAPGSPGYYPNYHGNLRTRDAAYHQGTVWSWLIGPYVDALLRVDPSARARARAQLRGLTDHLARSCIGQVAEVFDAEEPFQPRGCVAQAWGVAELYRALDRARETPRAPSLIPPNP